MVKRIRPRPEFAAEVRLAKKLREFEYPDLDTKPNPPVVGGGGGSIDVAAVDAPEWEKAQARFLCDGVDDHIEIQQAIDSQFLAGGSDYDQIQLSSGNFYVDMGSVFVYWAIHLTGMGKFATTIRNQEVGVGSDNPDSTGDYLIQVNQDGELSHLGFQTTLGFLGTCVVSDYGTIHNIHHVLGGAHILVYFRGTIYPSYSLSSWGRYNKAMLLFDENWIGLDGVFHQGQGTTLWFDVRVWGNGTISNVHIDTNNAHAIVLEEVGNLTISGLNVATGPPGTANDFAVFYVPGSPGNVNISDVNVEAAGYLVLGEPGSIIGSLSLRNVTARQIWRSIVDAEIGSNGFTLRDIQINQAIAKGTLDALRLKLWATTIPVVCDLSDLRFKRFSGNGINATRQGGSGERPMIKAHDLAIETDQHGVFTTDVDLDLHHSSIIAGAAAANTYDAIHVAGITTASRVLLRHNNILVASTVRYGINIANAGVERAIVVGNSGGDPSDFGTDAINDQGTDTQLFYPSDATYGDNFFRSGSTSGAPQTEQVSSSFDFAGKDQEFAGTVTPVQS